MNIKKLTIILCFLTSLGCQKTDNTFKISGEISNFDNGYFLVGSIIPFEGKIEAFDTVWINNGKFEYQGTMDCPRFKYFILENSENRGKYNGSFNMFFGNEKINIKTDADRLKSNEKIKIDYTGSGIYDDYNRITELLKDLTPGDTKSYIDVILKDKNYINNQVFPYIVYSLTSKEDVVNRERYLKTISKDLHNNIYIKYLLGVLEREKFLLPGCQAPDFEIKDIDDNVYKLSDFRGKYVLFDFSASWCSWCIKEIPYLGKVYEIGKDKDFIMFTINLDDKKDVWQKVIDKKNVPWKQLSDLKTMKGGVAKQYNITGIPQIFFIDKNGVIIENNLRGDRMVEYIDSVLNIK